MAQGAKILDRASGYLFLTGFLTAKLKNIPITLVAAIFNLVSLFAYLVGYITWYVAAYLYSGYPRKREEWYGFAEFKIQYQVAALIGLIATITCLLFPPLILPVAWFYAISNAIWSISEHHKRKNPPLDNDYSSEKQEIYFRYATAIAINSAITAVAASLALLFPPVAFTILMTATVVGSLITVAGIYYWGKHAFGNYPPDRSPVANPAPESYRTMTTGLGATPIRPSVESGLSERQDALPGTTATSPATEEPDSDEESNVSLLRTHSG